MWVETRVNAMTVINLLAEAALFYLFHAQKSCSWLCCPLQKVLFHRSFACSGLVPEIVVDLEGLSCYGARGFPIIIKLQDSSGGFGVAYKQASQGM